MCLQANSPKCAPWLLKICIYFMGLENLADPPGTAMDGLAGSIQRLRGIAEPAVLEHLPDIEKFLGKLVSMAE
ncbi:MAG: hypothetical protein M1133_16505 [Armatimonadetes bacterium]|nr:hypothetical protein [Armatimonadota bacterium]